MDWKARTWTIPSTLSEILRYFIYWLPTKGRRPLDIMQRLLEDGCIDESAFDLFKNLQDALNAGTHGAWSRRVTEGEALAYREQAKTLNAYLRGVLARLKENPPQRPD
jgi:Txe/YoeB family toxin of Txe-Axe toxin-antitoxin module